MNLLLKEARFLLNALASEEFVPTERITQLAKDARHSADRMDRATQQELTATINQLIDAMGSHMQRSKSRLSQLQSNRRSLKKFGHLRTHAIGQRYYNSI